MNVVLRPYQVAGVSAIISTEEDLLLERPTGSGKTVELVAGAAKLLQTGKATHVVITTSRVDIEDAFVQRTYDRVEYPKESGSTRCHIEVPMNVIVPSRDVSDRSSLAIEDYVSRENTTKTAIICQSQSFVKVKLNRPTSGMVLLVDEAHHAQAPQFSKVLERWRELGGRVVFATATPYRADGKPVLTKSMTHEAWTMVEHMESGYCPKRVMSEMMSIGPGPVSFKRLFGEEPPDTEVFEEMFTLMANDWSSEPEGKRHKLVVRVPPMEGGSHQAVEMGLQAFKKAGARVFDATGIGSKKAENLSQLLKEEKTKTYDKSEVDVIIGIQRVAEGMDWIHCSAVYTYGLPGSKGLAVQLLGRAMRMKDSTHPFANESKFSCYVETAGGKTLEDMKQAHSREAMLMCCMMSDLDTRQEWAVTRAVLRGVSKRKSPEEAKLVQTQMRLTLGEDAKQLARARLLLSQGLWVKERSVERAVLELQVAGFEGEIARRAVLGHLSTQGGFGKKVENELYKRIRIPEDVEKALQEAVEFFKSETLEETETSNRLAEQVHILTGQSIREAARKLQRINLPDEFNRKYTKKDILRICQDL